MDLAALLLEEGAVPADALARAIDRQREEGGALDTALLEEGLLAEDVLLGYLSRASDLPAAPATAWDAADARARRVFPSRVAERHGLAPFALDGRELALVATHPVDVGLLDEISFMLSLNLTAYVGPEWRVRELIHRLYGGGLAPRFAALAAAAGAPVAAEPEAPPEPEGAAPEAPPPAPAPTGFARDASEPLEPLAAALQEALESFDPALFEDDGAEEEPGPEVDEGPAVEPDRSAPPRWSLDDARAALAAARDRDAAVLAALRYARDFFEYAAVFAVTRDAIAGHDALGAVDERDRARSVAIWATDPGVFRTALETRSPFLGPVSREAAGNEAILSGLGRDAPRAALVFPVLLRDRPVCLVYADNGEAPVSARRLGDLLLFLSGLGAAFERIIRARKKRRRRRARAAPAAAPEPPAGAPPPEPVSAPVRQEPLPADPAPDPAPRAETEPGDVDVDVDVDLDEPAAAPAPPASAAASAPPAPAAPPAAPSLDALEEQFFFGSAEAEARAAPPAVAPPTPPPPAAPERLPAAAAGPPEPVPAAPRVPGDPPALAAVADRALEADAATSDAACDTLAQRRRDPAIRQAAEKLRRALLSGISARARRASRALGAIRDGEAIPLLIQVLETSEPETAKAASDALAEITLQRLGTDARRWLGWWKENRGRGRAEWLFSGLTSPDREIRVAASVELSTAAAPPVAYSADLPPPERERIARLWAGWWARSGLVL